MLIDGFEIGETDTDGTVSESEESNGTEIEG